MIGAGVDHKFDDARLPFRQLPAIRRRRHRVLRADEDERGKLELSVRPVGARRIESRRGFEREITKRLEYWAKLRAERSGDR